MAEATLKFKGRLREEDAGGVTVLTATIQYDVVGARDQIEALSAVPERGADHPQYGPAMRVSSRDAEHVSGDYYVVTTDYSSRAAGGTGNPLDRTPEVEWDLRISTEEVDRDYKGHPITNSVGDAPQTRPQVEIWEPGLRWVQWETGYDIRKAMLYSGAVNLDDIFIGDVKIFAQECRCTGIRAAGAFRAGTSPLPIEYTFGFRQRFDVEAQGLGGDTVPVSAFDFRFRDQGAEGFYIDGSNVRRKGLFHNTANEPAEADVWLDGTGQPLNTEVKLTSAMKAPIALPQPPGAIVDLSMRNSDPPAVFLFYQKCGRQPFRGLIPIFK